MIKSFMPFKNRGVQTDGLPKKVLKHIFKQTKKNPTILAYFQTLT